MTFLKRIGPPPDPTEALCVACHACPDIWELEDGDFAIIGKDITAAVLDLPPSAGCGPGECMVKIPRKTLVLAKSSIPDS